MGAWSIFWTSPELFSAVVSVIFPFLCWWTWGVSSRSFTTEHGLQLKTPGGADNVSSMSIWWVYSQSASQHFFGSVVLQSSFSLSCTYALGEWSVVSHRWSRRTPAGFCIWSNQWGYFTERGRKNWTFTKSELRVNCFYTDMKQLHLHWLNKIFMLYQCTVHGGLGFLFKDPEPLIFFWQWACGPVKVCFFFIKHHVSQPGCLGWWISFVSAKVNVLSITFWWLPEDLQSTT